MNALEEFDNLLRFGYNSKMLSEIKPKLENYLQSCPEEEKAKCKNDIKLAERLISECKEVDKFRQQYNLFHGYVLENSQIGIIELEYIEPYGNSYGVYIKVDKFVMELIYKPMNKAGKNEVRTKFYFDVNGLYKQFMIRKEVIPNEYANLQRKRRDYYPTSVGWDNWGQLIIESIKKVANNPDTFLQMCQTSCPFNYDGKHKYKSWKTKATAEIAYEANTGVIQGVKKGEVLSRSHIVGGNGSYRFFEKGDYVLKVVLDCLACEKPIKHDYYVNIDAFMRQLKESKGWGRNMPYKKVNAAIREKVEVITYDMDKDPIERDFYPVDYNGSWITFLEEEIKEI